MNHTTGNPIQSEQESLWLKAQGDTWQNMLRDPGDSHQIQTPPCAHLKIACMLINHPSSPEQSSTDDYLSLDQLGEGILSKSAILRLFHSHDQGLPPPPQAEFHNHQSDLQANPKRVTHA